VDTKALIDTARKVSADSYVARCRALHVAGWAFVLRRKSAEFRQAHAAGQLRMGSKR
jgi:hypothetical protein